MQIRRANAADFSRIWPIFQEVVEAGDTYGYDPDTHRDEAELIWMEQAEVTCVAETGGVLLGTYYLKPNNKGPGAHVCNCGYMVPETARGRGVATAMCEHSQELARALGYKAMQFNLVASTNPAVRLWTRLGFDTVGTLPRAFDHPTAGYVDALVMYKWLAGDGAR